MGTRVAVNLRRECRGTMLLDKAIWLYRGLFSKGYMEGIYHIWCTWAGMGSGVHGDVQGDARG